MLTATESRRPAANPAANADEIICVCRGITRGQIEAGLAGGRCQSVADLTRTTGAGSECGACTPALSELMGDNGAWTEVTATTRLLSGDAANPQRIEQVDLHLPADTAYPAASAGQHLTVQGLIEGRWISRTYTIINPPGQSGVVSIAVRRVPDGGFTPWLLQSGGAAVRLRISRPRGDDYWLRSRPSTVCMVGGIGITMARSLLAQWPAGTAFHLDYSARSLEDQVFQEAHRSLGAQRTGFTMRCRTDDIDGYITQADVVTTVAQFPGAGFVLCGPPPYVASVDTWLRQAGVPGERIHIEKFFLPAAKPPVRRSWKTYGYRFGAPLALLPALWLLPGLESMVPHHRHNVGHENLACADCHQSAPGTLRQQLQAKLDFWLGKRETDAAFMFKTVSNPVCLDCHRRSNDHHPSHRFLEPRFADVRATLGPQLCVSCHREHHEVRLTRTDTGFCAACHAELEVKNDRITPTHAQLIGERRWSTCLGCHDFHNNHGWKAPETLAASIPPDRIRSYFATGPSPYGAVREKAEEKRASPGPKD